MSNLLEQASLVLIPSGYKEDVVYSEIPLDGSGDLQLTRASNGTRINSSGLVEVCAWNLVKYSEDFSNADWVKSGGATITANDTTAPNGTLTADKINLATNIYSGAYQLISQPIGIYANSIYAKAGTFNYLFVLINGSSGYYVWFNLTTGTVSSKGGNMDGIIESVGNGWYRCTATRNLNTDTNYYHQFGFSDAENFTPTTTGNAYVWGAQANIGSTAKPYFPTTDRLNVPRLTYQNGGGGCPSLLLEKQSTNLLTYSEQFNDASWSIGGASVTANNVTSPDGTQNADKLVENTTSTTTHYINKATSLTATSYTLSVFAKAAERKWIFLIATTSADLGAFFDLENGVVGTVSSGYTAAISNVGNGWYRCSITFTATATTWYSNFLTATANNTYNYSGTIGSGIYIWGAQLEASSYPTSYIPTTSSSATRVADACFKTGITSLIGQTEGTFFFEIDKLIDESKLEGVFYVSDGTSTTDVISFYFAFSNQMVCTITASNTTQAQFTIGTITGRTKIALAYKANDFALYKNGSVVGTDTSGSVPALNKLTLGATQSGSAAMTGVFNQAILFKTRLTNAELASLTTI